jgi:hypothetical protein
VLVVAGQGGGRRSPRGRFTGCKVERAASSLAGHGRDWTSWPRSTGMPKSPSSSPRRNGGLRAFPVVEAMASGTPCRRGGAGAPCPRFVGVDAGRSSSRARQNPVALAGGDSSEPLADRERLVRSGPGGGPKRYSWAEKTARRSARWSTEEAARTVSGNLRHARAALLLALESDAAVLPSRVDQTRRPPRGGAPTI